MLALRWMLVLALVAPELAAELRVGRAAVEITPPAGMPMAGYYNIRLNEGVHDPLYAKALVLEAGGTRAALVACDLIAAPWPLVEAVRKRVGGQTRIPPAHVMMSATHTHTGPEMSADLVNVADQTLAIVRRYHAGLPEKIADAVRRAEADLRPARAWAAKGREDSVSFIRRFLMKDGSVGWNPGKRNPDIVRPLGSIDPELPLIYFDSPQGDPLAAYVNFALHLDTVGGLQFSADYPATLAVRLAAAKDENLLTIFTLGACGNINHIDVSSPAPQRGHAEAARIGTILAGSVLRAFRELEPAETAPLVVRSATVELPVVTVSDAEVEKARQVVAAFGTSRAASFYEQVHASKVMAAHRQRGRPYQAEVQVITLGRDIAWVALPGEVFVELGKAIKLASPFPHTVVVELANDTVGDYIPDLKAYREGAYEVISTPVAPGGGERLVEAAVRLLIEARGPYPPAYRR
jgi:hypothetical protein